ncbi:MAG: hypothetical protein IKM31_08575 [Oscillospiraceae bacterium]|nr:hypothetical protein [Oscillospiraceae bacterium]
MKKTIKRLISLTAAMAAACSICMTSVSAGWIKSGEKWWYQNPDGSYPKSSWASIDGKWYLFDEAGWMLTGWQPSGGKWYFLDASGAMKTGWLEQNGVTYYLDASGAMVIGQQTIDGKNYSFAESGALSAASKEIVFWGVTGKKYHITPYCSSFKGKAANSGTIEEAKAVERTSWCKICSKGWTDEKLAKNGNPNV